MIIVNIFIYLFINTILYIISEPRVRKNIFGNFSVRFLFSCVRASYDLCARAHAHSLEGTLVPTWRLVRDSNPRPSGRKALSLPMRHHAQLCSTVTVPQASWRHCQHPQALSMLSKCFEL